MNFPIDKSYLVAGWLAGVFWGAFTVLFVACMITSFMHHRRRWQTLGAVTVMYCLATAHISFVVIRLIQAFIVHVNDADQGAIMYLADIGQPLNRSKDMVYITSIWLGDSILVWRCYMVWNRDWRIIALPCIMVAATAISGYGAVGQYFASDPFTLLAVRWANGMLAVSMVTNLVLTLLTAGRIWALTRTIDFQATPGSNARNRYRTVVLVVLETGMLVTVGKLVEFILFQLAPDDGLDGNNALYIVMDCMPQLMGIAPTFIILAVNQGFTSTGSEAYSVNNSWKGQTPNNGNNSGGEKLVFAIRKPDLTSSLPHIRTDTTGTGSSYFNESGDSGAKHV
ncbi:hypothetical protein K474DRAFT_1667460 [Panus rudis PR-1116 ss-1]|nr:hypothetical protein K474DRAFT_1667460 [Panus rudis PR-1116 ss-1]